jgi:phenylalanyl-tRNA synthetase alpha chain
MNQLLNAVNSSGKKTLDELADILQIPRAKVELLMFQTLREELVVREMDLITRSELTDEGMHILKEGLPENQLLKFLASVKSVPLATITKETNLSKQAVNAAIGQLRKYSLITIEKGNVSLIKQEKKVNEDIEKAIKALAENPAQKTEEKILTQLTRRKLIELKERQQSYVKISEKGKNAIPNIKIIETVSKLSPEHIRSGDWKSLKLKQYKITAEPKNIPVGRKHPYLIFLQEVKTKLLALGFSEMRGPLVETEFWNFDALFQAGELPSDKKLVKSVQKVHETGEPVGSRGWRYNWSPKKASRLLLRPQGTSVSARTLYNLKIPSKYFSIARCYRPDSVDATHLSEFNQMEGIVCDPTITFRDLLGVLKSFAIEVAGATEVKFRPDYYPFTSPSVELSARHPRLGYIEFGGAGIFRPEVTAPFGIKDPVIAWGLGVDRLYMVNQGINDIRELFTQKLEWLRSVPRV